MSEYMTERIKSLASQKTPDQEHTRENLKKRKEARKKLIDRYHRGTRQIKSSV